MVELLTKEEKLRFLKTLEEDAEFRYAVAGLVGLREVLDRLSGIEANIENVWKEIKKLSENQTKLWEEVRKLSENQEKLWEEVRKLSESQTKLWEEVRELRRGQNRLWDEVARLRKSFRQLGRSVGMSLEHFVAAFLDLYLTERGYPEEMLDIEVGAKIKYKGETVKIDILNKDPLVVGEVTTYLGSAEDVEKEVDKLLKRVKVVQEFYEKKVDFIVLAVVNLEAEAAEPLKKLTKKHGILVITGKEIESML